MSQSKIFIGSAQWECSPNLIICSRLHQYFVDNGYIVIQDPRKSDYIIVNSCGVGDRAKVRSLNIVQKYLDLKKHDAKIILFGCLIDIEREAADKLDVISIGFKDNHRLDEIFFKKKRFEDSDPYCDDTLRKELVQGKHSKAKKPTDDPIKIALMDYHPFLISIPLIFLFQRVKQRYNQMRKRFSNNIYVEISRGCTGNCNYCLVRKAREKLQSRSIHDILMDIKRLYNPSKDLFLVADDCGCYGEDKDITIIELLDSIHQKFPDLRLKINYIDPRYLLKHSEEFIRIFQNMDITVAMIPLQSGSQKVLKKMNRNYDVAKVTDVIKRIRIVSPSTIINSHFIVGHPGETWHDYINTLSTARFFDYPLPFEYSNNKGTVSAEMPYQVSKVVRLLRYAFFIIYLNVVMFFRFADTLRKR